MTLSPHSLATNEYMPSFLSRSVSHTPPSINTVVHHLAEWYNYMLCALRDKLSRFKCLYGGLPFVHAMTDLWTEDHCNPSF